MRTSVYIATSLDGFIAREDGSVGWLMAAGEGAEEGEDYGYQTFFNSVDCMIMGRKSMEMVLSFDLGWPYAGKRTVILSQSMTEVPEALAGQIELYGGPLSELVEQLNAEGHQRAYIDGGRTIQSFLNEGLLTDLIITRVPLLLGRGIPLFGPTAADISLQHVRTDSYSNGFVQSEYRVIR